MDVEEDMRRAGVTEEREAEMESDDPLQMCTDDEM